MADKNKVAKKDIIKYAVLIVLVLAALCGFIALLLYRDSAKVATKRIVNKYYESITKDDSKAMEKLLLDKDRAEIVKAADNFEKYFDNIGNAVLDQYGSGYSVTVENFDYQALDETVRKNYEDAYELSFTEVGIVSYDIIFASAPSAKLDGGQESDLVNLFRDSMVVAKYKGDWYPLVSVGLSDGLSQRYLTAMEVGDKRVTMAEYNFFYNMFASGLEEGENPNKNEVAAYVAEVYTMCAAAEKAGFKPEQADIDEMERQLAEIKEVASAFKEAEEKYYSAYYGMGMTEGLLRDVYYAQLLMNTYIAKITSDIDPDDKTMQEYYEKNKNTFDTVDFIYYEIYSGVEGSLSDATERATEFLANVSSIEEFKASSKAIYDGLTEEQKSLNLYMKEAALGEDYTYYDFQNSAFEFRDWVFSEARVEGDKKYFAVDSGDDKIGYIIVMAYMISPRGRAEYNTVNFIYATVLTEEGKEEDAITRLTEAKDKWLSGEKTAESFGMLADEFYTSESDKEDGGSYVLISKGDMVDDIDSWIFDKNRKEGDCEIVKSEGAYHLLYFIGEDIEKWKVEVKAEMSYDKVAEIYAETSKEIGIELIGANIAVYC